LYYFSNTKLLHLSVGFDCVVFTNTKPRLPIRK
jgi:hypothetical protein